MSNNWAARSLAPAGAAQAGFGASGRASDGVGGAQAECLECADQAVELAHGSRPALQESGLLRGQPRSDGLGRDFAGPEVVGAMEDGWIGATGAGRLSATHHALADRPAQHEADAVEVTPQGPVACFEALERAVERGGGGGVVVDERMPRV